MMSGRLRMGACLALVLFLPGDRAPADNDQVLTRQLRAGMTPAEVRTALGPPRRMARQILYHRYLEQWLYQEPSALRLEFDCTGGQPARLMSASSDSK